MYGDRITRSMQVCLDETARRRKIQHEHNLTHGITPQTVKRKVNDLRALVHDEVLSAEQELAAGEARPGYGKMCIRDRCELGDPANRVLSADPLRGAGSAAKRGAGLR